MKGVPLSVILALLTMVGTGLTTLPSTVRGKLKREREPGQLGATSNVDAGERLRDMRARLLAGRYACPTVEAEAGQVAVITGASSGIGKAIALGLAASGATPCLIGRRREALEQLAEEIGVIGAQAFLYVADLAEEKEIRELASRLGREVGGVDILVHSAGIISRGRLETAPVDDLDWQYRTNVRAPYLLTQMMMPLMKTRQGQIVFINSSVGMGAKADVGQYAATKHALKALADSLREEVNPEGIRVLSVFLGRTATPMQAALYEREGQSYHPELLLQPENIAAVVMSALSLPRTAEVTELSIRPLLKS